MGEDGTVYTARLWMRTSRELPDKQRKNTSDPTTWQGYNSKNGSKLHPDYRMRFGGAIFFVFSCIFLSRALPLSSAVGLISGL